MHQKLAAVCTPTKSRPPPLPSLLLRIPTPPAISVSWWIVDLYATPPLTEGATPLLKRAMNVHNWSENYTRRVLTGYRQFLTLKVRLEDWNVTQLVPSSDVELLWQLHILDTRRYAADCQLLCGAFVHHHDDTIGWNNNNNNNNDKALPYEERATRNTRRANTRAALLEHFTDAEIDEALVWKEIFDDDQEQEEDDDEMKREEVRPATPQPDDMIRIRAKTMTNDIHHFRFKWSTLLGVVMNAIAERTGLEIGRIVFLLDGERLVSEESLADLEYDCDKGDEIAVMFEQTGC